MPRTCPHRAGWMGGGAARGSVASIAAALLVASSVAACAPEGEPEDTGEAPQPIAEAPVWTVTAEPMSVARHLATATRLPNGRVLVAGGRKIGSIDTGDVTFETAEIFLPSTTGFVEVVGTMSAKRFGATAGLLPGGEVLVVGGNGGPVATADLFDAGAASWEVAPTLAHPREDAASVVLPGGRFLVTGGDEGSASAEVFDPASQTWAETSPMLQPRRYHTATLLLDGRVLVVGGQRPDDVGKATTAVEIFDPASGTWSSAASMGTPRLGHTATRLPDGRVLVAGGSRFRDIHALGELDSAEIYDAASDDWVFASSMSVARAFHGAAALENGAVLIAGGVDETSSVLRSTELFDPEEERWVSVGLMTHGRLQHVTAPLDDGAVLVAGGELQSSAEVYRPAGIGQPCEVGRQCASGFCVDEVCCNIACVGVCLTCALPSAPGTCSPAAIGTDPHRDCGQAGPCDDVCGEGGACVDRVGDRCIEPECIDDRTRAIQPVTCEISGGGCPRVAVDCAPYRCGVTGSPSAAGCLDRCASIDDCAPGLACDGEGRCRLRPDVAALDPEACAASPGGQGSGRAALASLAGLALAVGARRLRRRPR